MSQISHVLCRSMNDSHMTSSSSPHVFCDAANLVLDPQHMRAAPCPKHRPHYMCTFGKTYNRYQPGAFQMACSPGKLQLKEFPQDHLRDIMESFQMQDDTSLQSQVSMLLWLE